MVSFLMGSDVHNYEIVQRWMPPGRGKKSLKFAHGITHNKVYPPGERLHQSLYHPEGGDIQFSPSCVSVSPKREIGN